MRRWPLLAGEVEDDLSLLDRDVLAAHGGQSEALVLLCVDLSADPEEAEVEQAHGAGKRPLPGASPADAGRR